MKLISGDCLIELKKLEDNSVDACVTDPPYELNFMGKGWDASGIAYNKDMWAECLRVLKPGGHLLSFGGTRTYHRMAVAIEDAGFEVRDMVEWIYASGFPKSLNVALQIEQDLCERKDKKWFYKSDGAEMKRNPPFRSKEANEWSGFGTSLKPAHEPICMARKPLAEKTVAENCLKYGTGGINIDESRVGTDKIMINGGGGGEGTGWGKKEEINEERTGRFPANLITDGSEEVRECFPDESERFFKSIIYIAKASKSERNMGCEGLETKQTQGGGGGIGDYQNDVNSMSGKYGSEKAPAKNNHPTVKPIALMEYLINMISREGQTILDPFMGSGSTGVAAKKLKRNFIGIEKEPEYVKIAEARIKATPEALI